MKKNLTTILIFIFAYSFSKTQNTPFIYQQVEKNDNNTLAWISGKTSILIDTSPDFATKVLDSLYNSLKWDDWWSSFLLSEAASDDCAGGTGTTDGGQYQRYDRGLPILDANPNIYPWQYYYQGISYANSYLQYEAKIDWTGLEALRLQYQAEARFLRAYMHFYLTRMFGKIPVLDHIVSPGEVLYNSKVTDIYTFIINDLKFCAENGLSAPYPGVEENWGHATKWAAEAMISRVYLFYSGYYNENEINGLTGSDVEAYIDDVIQNGGFDLVPQFASLWRVSSYSELGGDTSISNYAGEINPEVVWSVRYSGGNEYQVGGNRFARMIGPRNTNFNPYGQGWGAIPVLPTLWLAYDSADLRRKATILSWKDEGLTYKYTLNSQAQYTGYNSKKYEIASVKGIPEAQPDWQVDCSEDYMIIRFADVLLMGAELHLMNGDGSTALTYINKVRERAFGDTTHNYSTLTIDDIFKERKLELACEGIRYWDILRSCKGDFTKLTSILTYIDDADGGDFSQTTDVLSKDVDGNNFVSTKGLFQPPYELSDLIIIKDNKDISSQSFVYPNPVNNFLIIKVNDFDFSKTNFQLYDIYGKLLENKQISGKVTTIDMRNYVSSTYIVKIVSMRNSLIPEVKVLKIIKN